MSSPSLLDAPKPGITGESRRRELDGGRLTLLARAGGGLVATRSVALPVKGADEFFDRRRRQPAARAVRRQLFERKRTVPDAAGVG